jgi:hypothetical protein
MRPCPAVTRATRGGQAIADGLEEDQPEGPLQPGGGGAGLPEVRARFGGRECASSPSPLVNFESRATCFRARRIAAFPVVHKTLHQDVRAV